MWRYFVLLLLFVPALFACNQKHKCKSQIRVKTVQNAIANNISTYHYNAQGMLDSITVSNGSKTIIQYADGLVNGRTINKAGNLMSSWTCYLNKRGLVDSLVKRDSTTVTYTKKFIYDNNGFAIEERQYYADNSCITTHKVLDQDNISAYTVMNVAPYTAKVNYNPVTRRHDTISIVATNKEYTVYSEYYKDKIKTMAFDNYGSPEFGAGTKNVESRTVQISSEGDTMDINNFHYLFDHLGRAVKCVTTNQNGEVLDSSYISYY